VPTRSPSHVAAGPFAPAAEVRGKGKETADGAGQRVARFPIEHPDARAAAPAGAGDEVGRSVAVHVAERNPHAPAEAGFKRQEIELPLTGLGVVDLDAGRLSW